MQEKITAAWQHRILIRAAPACNAGGENVKGCKEETEPDSNSFRA
jgi:hypothetical protein